MKFFKSLKKSDGFTLVELMVVVAIIGILSAVAIPNFKRYQAKTKTSEAKLQLSAVYSALTSLQSDYDAYATCLNDAGYVAPPDGNYYAIGFSDDSDANDIVDDNGGTCDDDNHQFPAHKHVGGDPAAVGDLGENPGDDVDPDAEFTEATVDDVGSRFIAEAFGFIDPDNRETATGDAASGSRWFINENKFLDEQDRGY